VTHSATKQFQMKQLAVTAPRGRLPATHESKSGGIEPTAILRQINVCTECSANSVTSSDIFRQTYNKAEQALTPLDCILEVTVRDQVETPGCLDSAVRCFPQALESNVKIGHDSFLTNHTQGPIFCDITPCSPLKNQLRFRMNISPPSSGSRNISR
jgi:hypothetical protein